jgi:hypothetical protein
MLLTLDNEGELREAQAAMFSANAHGCAWLLLNYVGFTTVHFTAGGSDSVEELRPHLQDDQIQYALVRLPVPGKTGRDGIRDVFVTFIGPGVGIIEKGKKTAHLGDVQALLQPFHKDVSVTNPHRFDTEA